MNEITIKALSPDLEKDYFDFFDNRAFSDGSPYYPCYCNAFNMSAGKIEVMRDQAKQYGGGIECWVAVGAAGGCAPGFLLPVPILCIF